MNPKSRPALGRGLAALLGEQPVMAGEAGAPLEPPTDLPIERIFPNPRQPRRTFDETELEELADSIRTKGVLQAILVRPAPDEPGRYEIIAGERRWRASKKAGLSVIPAVVREFDDREVLEIAIIENVQRSDLNAMEEAEAYRALMDRFGRTQESVALQVGKSREHVANTMRLLNLPDEVREHVRAGRLTAGHARALLKTENAAELAAQVIARGMSVRETEALARREKAEAGAATSGASGNADAPRVPAGPKDVDTLALEADLGRALGLDVDIRNKGGKGELRIRFNELRQLDEICRILTHAHRDRA